MRVCWVAGCPVVMGPHTFNFAEAAVQAQAAGAAVRVANLSQAVTFAGELVLDSAGLLAMRSASLQFAKTHRGATDKLAQAIAQMYRDGQA